MKLELLMTMLPEGTALPLVNWIVSSNDSVMQFILFYFFSDDSSDSLFKTQYVLSPTRKQRNPTTKRVTLPANVDTDTSSDSSIEPRLLTLKAIFERFKKKKRKKRKYKPKLRPRGRPPGIKNARNPRRSQIGVKQIKNKGAVFPFLESENGRKPLPWKKILTYEVSHSHVSEYTRKLE